MKEDTRTDEQKARSKRAHATSMIAMGGVTTACALAAGLIALGGGDMPDFMFGRWGSRAAAERPAVRVPRPSLVSFEPWGDAAFARARREDKLVLLHLTASWSRHGRWMEENVYGDPACAALVKEKLVAVRADAEERPELAALYHRGYPTTALLLPDRRLVIAGTGMSCPMFKAFVDVVLAGGMAKAAATAETEGRRPWRATGPRPANAPYFPPWTALTAAELPKALKLEDPAWGGFYRYADASSEEPEYERLLGDQAAAVKALSGLDPAAAKRTLAFVERFLALPGGGYAASLDSEVVLADGRIMDGRAYFRLDDARRRALGLPKADARVFAAPNRAMAEATLASAAATDAQKAHARLTLRRYR